MSQKYKRKIDPLVEPIFFHTIYLKKYEKRFAKRNRKFL